MGELSVVFAGTPEFAVPTLEALYASPHRLRCVYTQPDRPAGRGRQLRASPVKRLAQDRGTPLHQPVSLKDPDAARRLAELTPDVMVVAAYGLLLPAAVLAVPRLGCINVHASLLPRWRGAAPIQRALLAGDVQTGISIMRMEVGLDTGDVLSRQATPIDPDETAGELHDRLAVLGADALVGALATLAAGQAQWQPQDPAGAVYAPKLTKQEARIDWSRPAAELQRCVRAFNPWPVAHTELDGKSLKVWRARLDDQPAAAPPGTVVATGDTGIAVATGDRRLLLTEVQLAGRRAMPAVEFVRAGPLEGRVLGAAEPR